MKLDGQDKATEYRVLTLAITLPRVTEMKTTLLLLTLLIATHAVTHAEPPDSPAKEIPFYTPEQDKKGMKEENPIDARIPNVLILGDSISIGYTLQVHDGLKGIANVIRRKANCGDTTSGLANIDKWLGDTKWNVIHFNWGLWDLCYRNPESKTQGNRDKANGKLSVPIHEYEKTSKHWSSDSRKPEPL